MRTLTFLRSFSTSQKASPRILITGSLGQLGSGLAHQLRKKHGNDNVIASDIKKPSGSILEGPFVYADVLDYRQLESIVVNYKIDWIVHFSALLSAVGEKFVDKALAVNITGFQNIIDLGKNHNLRIFCPSTIGAFGPSTPRQNTPDLTIMRPTTIYGITKVHMELMGEYYNKRYGVDFRSLRYPGVISADTAPGGGTTDYAVEIYHEALKHKKYTCFLSENTSLPMIYLPDCLEGTVQMLEAPREQLKQCVYNMAAFSFTPKQLTESIRKYIPELEVNYKPDFRQNIADSWPQSLDDQNARNDWGWKNKFDLDLMSKDMIEKLKVQYKL